MGRSEPTFSIVVEMENARTIDWDEIAVGLVALAREISTVASAGFVHPRAIFVHAGSDADTPLLQQQFAERAPRLSQVCEVVFKAVPGGRYYELKNAGVRLATGDVVVFSDSDTVPEDGWLAALLRPFQNSEVVAVNGHTYLGHDDFASRTFTLIWFFPLRDKDERFAAKRSLNANNSAFRRDWVAAHPYPENTGFKVSCTLLSDQLRRDGHTMVRADARASHYPPRGWRFFLWRALVTGRDADRKLVALRSPTRFGRVTKSFSRWFSTMLRVCRRVVGHADHVGMPVWQVPLAVLLGMSFYTLSFVAQLGMALGLTGDRTEHVPEWVERS